MPTPMDFPRLSRSAAELESALAGWLGARHAELMRGIGVRLDVLGVALALVGTRVSRVDDPQAARQRLADPGAAVAQIATPVGNAFVQSGFGTNDGQRDLLPNGERQQAVHVCGLEGKTPGDGGDSGVSRGAKDPGDLSVLRQPPGQGILVDR